MFTENHNSIEIKEEPQKLEDYLEALQSEQIETLSIESIIEQLEKVGTAVVTHDFVDGIRISKMPTGEFKTWTTNGLDDPSNQIAKKYRHRIITID